MDAPDLHAKAPDLRAAASRRLDEEQLAGLGRCTHATRRAYPDGQS